MLYEVMQTGPASRIGESMFQDAYSFRRQASVIVKCQDLASTQDIVAPYAIFHAAPEHAGRAGSRMLR